MEVTLLGISMEVKPEQPEYIQLIIIQVLAVNTIENAPTFVRIV